MTYEEYRFNGGLDRIDGPAVSEWDYHGQLEHESYWIDNEELTKEVVEYRYEEQRRYEERLKLDQATNQTAEEPMETPDNLASDG